MTKTMTCHQIDDPVTDQDQQRQRVNLNDGTSHCLLYLKSLDNYTATAVFHQPLNNGTRNMTFCLVAKDYDEATQIAQQYATDRGETDGTTLQELKIARTGGTTLVSAALFDAVEAVYYAGVWHCDRPVIGGEAALWEELRDAAGFEPGHSPIPRKGTK